MSATAGHAGMQVASRIWLLWGIIVPVNGPTTTGSIPLLSAGPVNFSLSISTLMVAWCLSEIIRYSFFALKVGQQLPCS
jgi:very-long-chain (3R)-3-hydroxyacyl-CoA dehydratase